MGCVGAGAETGHERPASRLADGGEEVSLANAVGLLDDDVSILSAVSDHEGENVERAPGGMLAERTIRRSVAPPAFMPTADT